MMLEGLMSRWMIPFLMGMLNGLTDLDEQIQFRAWLSPVLSCSQYLVMGTPFTNSITK